MKEKLRLVGPVILLAALVATAWCLLTYESEYLWKVQELNLFLDTPLFLKQQMVTSGWLLTWVGTYFTEGAPRHPHQQRPPQAKQGDA